MDPLRQKPWAWLAVALLAALPQAAMCGQFGSGIGPGAQAPTFPTPTPGLFDGAAWIGQPMPGGRSGRHLRPRPYFYGAAPQAYAYAAPVAAYDYAGGCPPPPDAVTAANDVPPPPEPIRPRVITLSDGQVISDTGATAEKP